jgi:hypothetical protein
VAVRRIGGNSGLWVEKNIKTVLKYAQNKRNSVDNGSKSSKL